MKNIVNFVKEKEDKLFKTADTVTFEGAKAWKINDKNRLMQYAMTGVLGRSFYVSQKDIVDEAVDLIKRSDPIDLANAIVLGRNEGYIRSFPILGLVYLSLKDSNLFQKTFNDIIHTGNDMEDFINLCHGVRGFGRSVKKAMSQWIKNNVKPYYALKYRKQIADAVRICRYKSDDSIYAFILKNVIHISDDKIENAYEKYKELKAFDSIEGLLKDQKYSEVAKIIVDYRLDVDSLTAFYNQFNKEIWTSIAEQSPVMRFLKYMNKFTQVGVDVSNIAKNKITVDNLIKAKVFPFRLFMTMNALQSNNKNQNVVNIISSVLDDYITKYDWSVFNKHSWAICPDVSGSMNQVCGSNGNLRYIDIAAMFTAFLSKGCNDVVDLPWSNDVKKYNVMNNDSVFTQMNYIRSIGGGGTNMSASLTYMINNDIHKDICVFITDTESYSVKSRWGGNGTSWIEAWIQYRSRNPNAMAIVIRGDCYNNQPMSEEQCNQYNIYQIFGWNDKVVDFIKSIINIE